VEEDRQAHVQAFNNPQTAEKYLREFRLYDMALRCKLFRPRIYGEVNGNLRRHAAAFKALVPDILVLHLVRNGPDFVRSVMSRNAFTDLDERNLVPPAAVMELNQWTRMTRFEKICWMWQYENAYLRRQADLTVRFEDIISDYHNFKLGILDPIGLALSEETWTTAVFRPQNATRTYLIGKWDSWSQTQKNQFTAICGSEMERYRYKLR
jgi:hypothetical protein